MMKLLLPLFLVACNPDGGKTDSDGPKGSLPGDEDGDGYSIEAGDCDDGDASVHPAATEVCDGLDQNCNDEVDEGLTSTWYADSDADGYGNADAPTTACTQPEGSSASADDCNDDDPEIHPGAPERCDGLDQDCDGVADNDVLSTWYLDADGDGYGDPAVIFEGCNPPAGYGADASDCDDGDATISPEGVEVCDELDNNCDGQTDEGVQSTWYVDQDGDGYGQDNLTLLACTLRPGYAADPGDCDDGAVTVYPGADEWCNGLDDNCDGNIDENSAVDALIWYADSDADGYGDPATSAPACTAPTGFVADDSDCDDQQNSVNPSASELCNGTDDDCDGDIDEEALDAQTWYLDSDGDSFGDSRIVVASCTAPAGYVAVDGDCDDASAEAAPGLTESCDLLDNDCDGQVDEADAVDAPIWYADADADGYGDPTSSLRFCSQPVGYEPDADDCDDRDAAIRPFAPEYCNGYDDNCDGQIDEAAAIDGQTWYADGDGDGYGDASVSTEACSAPAGYVAADGDCDDRAAAVSPVAVEVCNAVDDDCDGSVDQGASDATRWYLDVDQDGHGGSIFVDACTAPAGYLASSTDCNDLSASVNPAATESCNGVDDNCDGSIDEASASNAQTWYADADGDGHGDPAVSTVSCTAPAGYVAGANDCDDTTNAISPSAAEVCNNVDDNCDGTVDQGATDATRYYLDGDGDGYGLTGSFVDSCTAPSGYSGTGGDCDDGSNAIHPAASELCNSVDDNCDGLIDDADPALLSSSASIWYADADGDGFGDPSVAQTACVQPSGAVADASDCDDADNGQGPCTSCMDILASGRSTGDGIYSFDACGTGSSDYWCDMTTDGGGWTVAGWQASSATTSMGIADRGVVGDVSWSVDLACIDYSEIYVKNHSTNQHFQQSYTPSTWSQTSLNITIGTAGNAFRHGTYGPSNSRIVMGCVDYNYSGGINNNWACDSDSQRSAKGHLADYAGEYCTGARLDYTWAWSNGSTCSQRGVAYSWGYAIR